MKTKLKKVKTTMTTKMMMTTMVMTMVTVIDDESCDDYSIAKDCYQSIALHLM